MDEASRDALGLSATEAAVLMALLLHNGNDAAAAQELRMPDPMFYQVLLSLRERDYVVFGAAADGSPTYTVKVAERLTLKTEQQRLQPPTHKVVLRPLREQVVMVARSDQNPVRGAARAYTFVFGREVKNWAVLGKMVNALGVDATARLFLEHSLDAFDGDPLYELLPLAVARAKQDWRPEELGPAEPSRREQDAWERRAFLDRMEKWRTYLRQMELGIDPFEGAQYRLRPQQVEIDRRQMQADLDRWEREQRRRR